MNIEQMKKDMKKMEKFFVDQYGEIYIADDLHERLAREICEKNRWNWRGDSESYSAEDYLLHKKGFIKVSNYSQNCFKYVAISKKFIRNKHVIDNAEYLSDTFNLKLEVY